MTVHGAGKAKTAMLPALQMVSAWTAALQGAGDLGRAAELLMGILPLRDVQLVRLNLTTAEAKRVHASVGSPAQDPLPVAQVAHASTGEVLKSAETDRLLIMLGCEAGQCDLFVLRLFRPLSGALSALLRELAAILAASWAGRQPGLITARIVGQSRRRGPQQVASRAMAILDYSNPYALSRAEFRVCALIGQGLTAKRIARELRLSEATVRSHQRSIYAKTELGGQMEVMYHLQAHPTVQSLLNRLPGQAA